MGNSSNIDIDKLFVSVKLSALEQNVGQLNGLPPNPRTITKERKELLKQDIIDYPEMLEMRAMIVYPLSNGKYIILSGNMRYEVLLELGYDEAPCVIVPKETAVERLKAYTMLENIGFGQWDWDKIANEWEAQKIKAWGVELYVSEEELNPDEFFREGDESKTKNGEKIIIELPQNLSEQKKSIKGALLNGLRAYEGVTIN